MHVVANTSDAPGRDALACDLGPVLLLDTSAPAACVGVATGDGVRAEVILRETRRHAEELPRAIDEVLRHAGITARDLSRVIVGRGPGSFVGVRVALATAKGIATARQIPLHGVSSLAALAGDEDLPEGRGLAVLDARRGEIYCQVVERGAGVTHARGIAQARPPDAIADLLGGLSFVVGHGLGLIPHATRVGACVAADGPCARGLWRAFRAGRSGPHLPADERRTLVPDYARAPDAKLPSTFLGMP